MSMLLRETRSLTETQRKLLAEEIKEIHDRKRLFCRRLAIAYLSFCIFCCGLTIFAANVAWYWAVIAWSLIGACLFGWSVLEENSKNRKHVDRLARILEKNEAEVIHVESHEMVEFEEIEDEGATYAFQVDSEQILLLSGQEFYPTEAFPSSRFEIICMNDAMKCGLDTSIESFGDKLQPLRTISVAAQNNFRYVQGVEVLNGRLNDIERLLST